MSKRGWLVMLAVVTSCGPAAKKHTGESKATQTINDSVDYTWGDLGGTGAELDLMAGSTTATKLTVDIYDADDTVPAKDQVVGKVYEFGPAGTTFSPSATLRLPIGSAPSDAVIATAEAGDSAWTPLSTTRDSSRLSAPVAHFSLFAIVSASSGQPDSGTPDAGRTPMCTGDIVGMCVIVGAGSHTCTEQYGMVNDSAILCGEALGTWDAGAGPCDHTNVIGKCEHDSSGACGLAWYYSDGLSLMFAKNQCEGGGGIWGAP